MKRLNIAAVLMLIVLGAPSSVWAYDTTVFMEEMTSPEMAARIQSGAIVAIVPTGGTEQNGPHMAIGKHNKIITYTVGEIARKLGNALVAPVMAYVPEGNINPPEGHMNFAGTVSLREDTYAAVLEDVASSLKQHGFKLICFIGEHGGNQAAQKQVAEKLTTLWQASGVRVLQVSDYYDNNGQDAWVAAQKIAVENPAAHAGFEDTSELMAVDAASVRASLRGKHGEADYKMIGAAGDSTLASAAYGRHLLAMKITAAVNQIQHALPNATTH